MYICNVKIKQVIAMFGALLVVMGSIGIPLYKHTCLHEDLTIRTVFTPSDHCETEKCETPVVDACCKKELEKVSDRRCCEDEVSAIMLPLNYFEKSSISIHFEALPIIPYSFLSTESFVFPTKAPVLANQSNAPPLGVNERLPLYCIWRL